MAIYGSLQGAPIPDSVEYDKLPLGKQELIIVSAKDEPSKSKDSINVNILVASAAKGVRGTGFLRVNFRHTQFQIGETIFGQNGGYLDPQFLRNGLETLERLANSPGENATAAGKELTRARLALAQIKRLNEWAGLQTNLINTDKLKGVTFTGTVSYRDSEDNKARLDPKTGKTVYKSKQGKELTVKDFDMATVNVDVALGKKPAEEETPDAEVPAQAIAEAIPSNEAPIAF